MEQVLVCLLPHQPLLLAACALSAAMRTRQSNLEMREAIQQQDPQKQRRSSRRSGGRLSAPAADQALRTASHHDNPSSMRDSPLRPRKRSRRRRAPLLQQDKWSVCKQSARSPAPVAPVETSTSDISEEELPPFSWPASPATLPDTNGEALDSENSGATGSAIAETSDFGDNPPLFVDVTPDVPSILGASNATIRRPRQRRSGGRRHLPLEVVHCIVAYAAPDMDDCLAIRGVARVFRDAVSLWQKEDAKRLFAKRYGADQPSAALLADFPWISNHDLLDMYTPQVVPLSVPQTRELATLMGMDRRVFIGYQLPLLHRPSPFRCWVALQTPRAHPPVCLRCGRASASVLPRDRAGLGRLCGECYEGADNWLRWRLRHWVRAADMLSRVHQDWFSALNQHEWMDLLPCHSDRDERGMVRYAVNFVAFRELIEAWTDAPPRTVDLRPNGGWKVVPWRKSNVWPQQDPTMGVVEGADTAATVSGE
ncbi:hypothetical protein THASP1DRAFT_21323 [Thamnocephalis sphaerospora]|uniref:Uncharacterized protein n=1 Tax=Thamnocephalis sphaerospora TaxID=78915 RepID=A0A4P9XXK4_9FUNG|nr:hypothetical protein THASP1DRAFT_21323 [Thamnocephalis sphaerospora]|eukprot:RKP11057.1 hypothetical protein THASP1DRAFT_21323 [Thamnocephalis sphaerospora]